MKFIFSILLIVVALNGTAQQEREITSNDSLPSQVDTVSILRVDPMADEKNALYSAVIPGWGQVRNKQYVKAGGIFAGFTFSLLQTIDASNEFNQLDENYNQFLINYDMNVNTVEEIDAIWEERQDARTTKDIWTGATTYVYVGNLIDAAAQYKIIREKDEGHSATKAAYYSAILPGLGQAYNKKYWKIPIVYTALGTSLYFAKQNRDYHRDYQREVEYRSVGETTGFRTLLIDEKLTENLEYWRKWRDAAYIITGVVYVLNIADATVDAHLYDFNVDDELTIDVSPVFSQMNGLPYYAVQLNIPILQ